MFENHNETVIKNQGSDSPLERLVMCQPQSVALNEDCMDVMKRYADKFFALAIVDPPYGIACMAKEVSHTGNSTHSKMGKIGLVIGHNFKPKQWDDAIPDQNYFDELFRVSKHQIIFGENYLDFAQKKTSSGRIIWDKVNGDTNFSDCEIAWKSLLSSVREVEYMWNGMMQGKSITEGRTPQANKRKNEKKIHLTQKPVLLYDWILSTCAEKGWKMI